MSQLQLMRVLKFTTEDLRLNRDGQMSDAQRERFQPPKINPVVMMAVLGHLALVGGLVGVLAIITGSKALWLVLGMVVVLTFMPFGMMQEFNRVRPVVHNDVTRGKVARACGVIALQEKQGRTSTFELIVDGVALPVSPAEAAAFQSGHEYCVYYLPDSKTLLTAEPVH